MTTGERIKARRKQLAISADTLAEKIGVSRSTVFRWEKGEIEKVPAIELNSIASVLQTSAEYLIGIVDDPDQKFVSESNYESTGDPASSFSSRQTPTFRIISSGLSELPPEEQEKILNILRAMYANRPELFKRERNNDETGL